MDTTTTFTTNNWGYGLRYQTAGYLWVLNPIKRGNKELWYF